MGGSDVYYFIKPEYMKPIDLFPNYQLPLITMTMDSFFAGLAST